MRCINCGIAMQRLQRYHISSLSAAAHHQTRLSNWITNAQAQLPLDIFICHPCLFLLNTEAGEHGILLGHKMVCLGCGKSDRKIRHHNVSKECPLLASLVSKNTNYLCALKKQLCLYVCWMRANKQEVHDSSREMQELTSNNNAAAPNVQVVSPPEPSLLPPVQRGPLRRESNTSLKQLFM